MHKGVVLIGIGEIGGIFARGFLRLGHPVYPVVRGMDLSEMAEAVALPAAVVVAVGEKDLHDVLDEIPEPWQDRLVLLQNELLPRDWRSHHIHNPTVISVWFEKKPWQDTKVLIPSPVFGPQAELVKKALNSIHIPCMIVADDGELLFELVQKNVYILTVNIAGLEVGGTVGELWKQHQALARRIANDVMGIQFCLIEKELDREKLIQGMVAAFNGDLDHKCMGRSAPARLERAILQADEFGLEVETLKEIQRKARAAVS